MATQRKTNKTSPGSSPVSHTNMDAGSELHIESHVEEKVRLSCCQKVTYAFPRGATTGMGLQLQQTVRAYYIDGLGVTPKALAMLIAICKCLDFLIGFGIGYSSDKLNTRWGRRKPFIAVMFPIWVFVMLMLFSTCTLASVLVYIPCMAKRRLPLTPPGRTAPFARVCMRQLKHNTLCVSSLWFPAPLPWYLHKTFSRMSPMRTSGE
jgi:hypothetical protein